MSNQNRNQQPKFFCDDEVQVRSTEGGVQVVSGYAAVFSSPSRLITERKRQYTEEIAPGAFDQTDFSDVYCCFDHKEFLASDPTLRFRVDARGLYYEYDHDPEDPAHVSALQKIKRRNAKGSSFTFVEPGPECYTVQQRNGIPHRILHKVPRVIEFGPVILPAYTATTAFARSLDAELDTPEPEPESMPAPTPPPTEPDALLETRRREARYFLT